MTGLQVFRHPDLVADLDGLVNVAVLVGHGAVGPGRIVHTRGTTAVKGVAYSDQQFVAVPDFGIGARISADVIARVGVQSADASAETAASDAVFTEGIADGWVSGSTPAKTTAADGFASVVEDACVGCCRFAVHTDIHRIGFDPGPCQNRQLHRRIGTIAQFLLLHLVLQWPGIAFREDGQNQGGSGITAVGIAARPGISTGAGVGLAVPGIAAGGADDAGIARVVLRFTDDNSIGNAAAVQGIPDLYGINACFGSAVLTSIRLSNVHSVFLPLITEPCA